MIDIKNGEQIFVEKEGGRKYRLGSNGGKKYEDEKPKKQCDLPATSPDATSHSSSRCSMHGWRLNSTWLAHYDCALTTAGTAAAAAG